MEAEQQRDNDVLERPSASPFPFEDWRHYLQYGIPLYKAALKGNWEVAEEIHSQHPTCFEKRITEKGDSALHIAAVARNPKFVEQLLNATKNPDRQRIILTMTNNMGNNALCLAAAAGNVETARVMVEKLPELPNIRGRNNWTPLHMAAILGKKDMINYLWKLTTLSDLIEYDRISLFINIIINSEMYDKALEMLEEYPNLAIERDEHTQTALHVLAKKSFNSKRIQLGRWSKCCNRRSGVEDNSPDAKGIQLVKRLWEEILKQKQDTQSLLKLIGYPWRFIFVAVQVGNVEFVKTSLSCYPDLVWQIDDDGLSIFHMAIKYRQDKIFKLIDEFGAIKDFLATIVDSNTNNNMLHFVGLLPLADDRLNCISGGEALQMHQEITWFKVVENMMSSYEREAENIDGKTPATLFTECHKELRKEGEKWMRKMATSCSVVAALIIVVAFAAAIKVPDSDEKEFVRRLGERSWSHWLFAVFDSVSLLCSTGSILNFFSILTSRYSEEDFLTALPSKLLVGLGSLFFSNMFLLGAYIATFYVVFEQPIFCGCLGAISVCLFLYFGKQQLKLIFEVFGSLRAHKKFASSPQQLFLHTRRDAENSQLLGPEDRC